MCAFRKALNTPVLLRSYASREDADVSSVANCKIWEAARATSAAATFFDPINMGLHSYVDGATGRNNPVEEVLYEALSIWPDSLPRVHCIVSIGTGVPGLKDFGDDLLDVLRTLKTISTETETTAERFKKTHTLLGLTGRYFRFNVNKGLEAVGLDEHEKIHEIEAATDLYLKNQDVVTSASKLAELGTYTGRMEPEANLVWLTKCSKLPPENPMHRTRLMHLRKTDCWVGCECLTPGSITTPLDVCGSTEQLGNGS